MKNKRRKYSSSFKAKVALEALKEQSSLNEMCQKYDLHHSLITRWKKQFKEKAELVFSEKDTRSVDVEGEKSKLYEQIGKLKVENDFLKKALS